MRRTGCGNADAVDVVSSARHGRGARCGRGRGRGARRAEQVAPPLGWAGAGLAGGGLGAAQQTRPLQARCSVTGEWPAGPLEPVTLTLFTPLPPRPTAQVRLRCGDPQAPGSGPWGWGARPASTHPGCPTLAVWLSFLGVQGPLGICDSHGHRALHTGHRALPSAGWGGAWAGSTDAHDPWAWSQVSHHPPSAAHYVFSRHGWSLWQEITIASKFRGKYLSIMPLGEQGQKTCWGRGRVGRAWGLRG